MLKWLSIRVRKPNGESRVENPFMEVLTQMDFSMQCNHANSVLTLQKLYDSTLTYLINIQGDNFSKK